MNILPLTLALVELLRLSRVVHAMNSLSCYQTAARARTSTVDPLIQLQLSRSKGAEMMLPPPKCSLFARSTCSRAADRVDHAVPQKPLDGRGKQHRCACAARELSAYCV